jgi:hypothetical protein
MRVHYISGPCFIVSSNTVTLKSFRRKSVSVLTVSSGLVVGSGRSDSNNEKVRRGYRREAPIAPTASNKDKLAKARHEDAHRVQPEVRRAKDYARRLEEGRHERKEINTGINPNPDPDRNLIARGAVSKARKRCAEDWILLYSFEQRGRKS